MLGSAEASMISRDRELTGLATLLDADRAAQMLRMIAPDVTIETVVPQYLRYKPMTRCLAAYSCQIGSSVIPIHVVAHARDAAVRLARTQRQSWESGPLGSGVFCWPDQGLEVFVFPNDGRIESLGWTQNADRRHALLRRVLSECPDLQNGTLRTLAYKPERRYVAAVEVEGVPRAVLKLYTQFGYRSLETTAIPLGKDQGFESIERIGRSSRRAALAYRWVDGDLLQDRITDPGCDLDGVAAAGIAIASLHLREKARKSNHADTDAARTLAIAETLSFLLPELAPRVRRVSEVLASRLADCSTRARITHGDFYAKQVVIAEDHATLLDLDELSWGDPMRDLGVFTAHLERDAVGERVAADRAKDAARLLLEGYGSTRAEIDSQVVDLYTAAASLWIAPHFFRGRDIGWQERTETLLERIETLAFAKRPQRRKKSAPADVESFDPAMPFLTSAFDTKRMSAPLARAVDVPYLHIENARVIRHKRGRRCVIEYQLGASSGIVVGSRSLIAKIRAKGLDRATFQRTLDLYANGFGADAADGISVPQAVGVVPSHHMWLQRKGDGIPGEVALLSPDGPRFCSRVAEFIHKLQNTKIECSRTHTIRDELDLLHQWIPTLAAHHATWRTRLDRLLHACDELGSSMVDQPFVPAHRDLHPGQLLAGAGRLFVLDLDLVSLADPALDAGNFIAHITELSLRLRGHADALAECERALTSRLAELAIRDLQPALEVYTTLSLVRHIVLSTRYPDRSHTTEDLLDLCEKRLGLRPHEVEQNQNGRST